MNTLRFAILASLSFSGTAFAADTGSPTFADLPPPARIRISPHETITAYVPDRSGDEITLTYGRPYTKNPKTGAPRIIWGDLVPFGKADRMGADEATLFITRKAVTIGTVTIPAGAYTLYIVPSATGASQLAFSTSIGKWGIPVDETHDVGRFDLSKDALASPVDQLTLWVGKDGLGGGVIKILWEKTQFSLHFSVVK